MKKSALILAALLISSVLVTGCGKTSVGVYTDVPEYSVGTLSEDGYKSEWSGIKFTPSENVFMASDEEYAEFEAIADAAAYEMMATDASYNTVIVRSAELPEKFDFEDYIAAQLDDIRAQYAANGITVESFKTDDVSFGGRVYRGTVYSVSMGNAAIYQCIYRAALGNRISEVCFTYSDSASLDTLMNCFEK